MKIAVTYENGEVFQHFGHTGNFKLYEIEDGKIISSTVIESNGQGHGALAGLLNDNSVNVIICGGLGGGAYNALTENGIEVVAGVTGNADEAVEKYLKGELESSGVNCDHHGEEHHCGDHEEGHSCGSGCGGCHGGCHGAPHVPDFEGKNVGKTVRVHYRGTFDNGIQFDSSYDRDEPLEFVCGAGMMIHGFDKAVANMEVGDIVNVHLMPEEAYGKSDPAQIYTVKIAELPGSENVNAGERVYLQDNYGRPIPVTVTAKDDTTITFDANHEMAGKELNFKIELVEVK